MKRAVWAKAVESAALLAGYLWYNARTHWVLTRILS
jgi:hypothetical protein